MLPKLALSITSFLPLYSLMVFMYSYVYFYENINSDTRRYMSIIIVIILAIQILCTIIVNKYIGSKESSKISENEIVFSNINEDKKAYVNYMMTYIIPLLIFDLDKINAFYLLYTNTLVLVFVFMNAKAENFNFNIFLWIKGYSIYTGTNIDGFEKVLLIKKSKFSNIRSNHAKYKFVSFGASNDIYICKKYNE